MVASQKASSKLVGQGSPECKVEAGLVARCHSRAHAYDDQWEIPHSIEEVVHVGTRPRRTVDLCGSRGIWVRCQPALPPVTSPQRVSPPPGASNSLAALAVAAGPASLLLSRDTQADGSCTEPTCRTLACAGWKRVQCDEHGVVTRAAHGGVLVISQSPLRRASMALSLSP